VHQLRNEELHLLREFAVAVQLRNGDWHLLRELAIALRVMLAMITMLVIRDAILLVVPVLLLLDLLTTRSRYRRCVCSSWETKRLILRVLRLALGILLWYYRRRPSNPSSPKHDNHVVRINSIAVECYPMIFDLVDPSSKRWLIGLNIRWIVR